MVHQSLNNDVVFHIFSYLSPVDLLSTAKVCQSWNIWTDLYRKQLLRLNYDNLIKQDDRILQMGFIDVLKYFPNILEFKLKGINTTLNTFNLHKAIADHCLNIRVVIMSGIKSDDSDILHLARCNTIEIISLNTDVKDIILGKLFLNNPNLKNITICQNNVMTGTCLSNIPDNIKELHLFYIYKLQASNLLLCLVRCRFVHSLSVDLCYNFPDTFLEDLAEIAPNLKYLSLRYLKVSLHSINRFQNLRTLCLFGNEQVNDEVLKVISESCKHLENLEIGPLFDEDVDEVTEQLKITERGIICLSKLKNLKKIILKRVDKLDRSCVQDVMKQLSLRVFQADHCNFFNDDIAFDVIHHCKELVSLEIMNCAITIDTLKAAVSELNNQPKREKLLQLKLKNVPIDKESGLLYTHRLLETSIFNTWSY